MLSECQTAWIWVRRRVTRRLIQIQAVCIWHYMLGGERVKIGPLSVTLFGWQASNLHETSIIPGNQITDGNQIVLHPP